MKVMAPGRGQRGIFDLQGYKGAGQLGIVMLEAIVVHNFQDSSFSI